MRKTVVIFCCLVLLSCTSVMVSSCVNPSVVAYSRGRVLYDSGDYKGAVEEFDSAIRFEPEHYDAHLFRAYSYQGLDRYAEAIKDFDWTLNKKPGETKAIFNRAWCISAQGKYKNAIAEFDRLIKVTPKDSEAFFHRGYCHYNLNHHKAADRDFTSAIDLMPRQRYFFYRGLNAQHLLDYRKMYDDLEQATIKSPHDAKARLYLAWAAFYLSRDETVKESSSYFLALTDWHNDSGCYAVLLTYLAHLRQHNKDAARAFLTLGLAKLKKSGWPYPILECLDGKISETELIRKAHGDGQLLEAYAYVGAKKLLLGDKAAGQKDLLKSIELSHPTVMADGQTLVIERYFEYDMALSLLGPRPVKKTSKTK